jgi:HSP20 family protein
MDPMPWDPMRDLLTMQERLESLFGQGTPGWVPPVDLAEMDDRFVVTIELPGVTRNDVHVECHEQVLTIRGERAGQGCYPGRYQQLERGQGSFARSFRFAVPIADDEITADLVDGVLTVVAPKAAKRRGIDIKVGH